QRGAVVVGEPISGVERQELDFSPFRKVRGFIHDESSRLHASFQCHSCCSLPDHMVEIILRSSGDDRCRSWSAMPSRWWLAGHYPVPTRARESAKSCRKQRADLRFGTEGFKSSRPDQKFQKINRVRGKTIKRATGSMTRAPS